MFNYQVYFIIKGRIKQGKAEQEFEKISKQYDKMVQIKEANFVGKRKLAYSVKNNTEGYFGVIKFSVETKEIAFKSEEILQANDNILKYITIREEN